ncbi:DUF58 domain-containing protein [Candidatus Fermentibacteria bacterium]|nr:MAG: DUF58 domain-containing protein [Candidatus Fermentibacteria bacterium]
METAHSLFRRVQRIEIHTRKLVDQLMGGNYRSVFRGQGMEFCDYRPYVEGDDPRLIDWNVTARATTPFVKILSEERELQVILMVDVSGSLNFGSINLTKADRVAETSAVIALSASGSGDRIGLLTFGDRVYDYVPPEKGRGHALALVQKVLQASDHQEKADIEKALKFLGRVLKRKALIFLVSDFRFGTEGERQLKVFSAKHDMVGIHVFDPRELRMPDVGRIRFRDPETGKASVVNTSSRLWQRAYAAKVQEQTAARELLCRKARLDVVSISTTDDLILPLRRFFHLRKRRRAH